MAGELDKFCQNTFGAGAGLSRSSPGKTAYDWECQTADAALVGISMADACRYITGNKLAFELLVRFNDPYGWTCWEPA
jgi:hypothetical protein